jgi:hypothetical protein
VSAGPPPGPGGGETWNGPWVEDARRVLRLVRATLDEAGRPGGPLEQGLELVRRAGPELLDEVAGLAGDLAARLRADAAASSSASSSGSSAPSGSSPSGSPSSSSSAPLGPPEPAATSGTAPPTTVRIDVTG